MVPALVADDTAKLLGIGDGMVEKDGRGGRGVGIEVGKSQAETSGCWAAYDKVYGAAAEEAGDGGGEGDRRQGQG